MKLQETTVNKNYVYQGKILKVRCDDAALPDGRPCKREIIEHVGASAVLCVREGKVLLVKQFRYAFGEEIYEIPAGKLNVGEDPLLSAVRELKEETGVEAKEVELIYTIYPTPGYSMEKIYIFNVLGFEDGEQVLDDGEFLNVEWMPLEEAYEKVASGEIRDSKTIIALLHYKTQHTS